MRKFISLLILALVSTGQAQDYNSEREALLIEASQLELPAREDRKQIYSDNLERLSQENDGNPNIEQVKNLMVQLRDARVERDNGFRTPKPQIETLAWDTGSNFAHYSKRDCAQSESDLTSALGARIKMLNYALVFNGPGKGRARLGHTMQRIDYCRNGELQTLLISEGPLATNEVVGQLRTQFQIPSEVSLRAPVQTKGDALFTWVIPNLPETYHERLGKQRRDMYEVHLDMSQENMYKALLINMKRFGQQLEDVNNGVALITYHPIERTCLRGFRETMRLIYPGFSDFGLMLIPKQLFNYASQRGAKRIVVYKKPDA